MIYVWKDPSLHFCFPHDILVPKTEGFQKNTEVSGICGSYPEKLCFPTFFATRKVM